MPSVTRCGIALSGGAAGAASGLFQVRLEGCCEAPCACWQPFMAQTGTSLGARAALSFGRVVCRN